MKALMLVCQEMADEPLEILGGRTPLEVAKMPVIQQLAKSAKMGSATFTPHYLSAAGDVACLSLLGFNPKEFYTGIGPLEAIAAGIDQKDNQIIFRCDLVTVMDEMLIDAGTGAISQKETALLIEQLNKKLSTDKIRFSLGRGHKNFLIVSDPEMVQSLDALECQGPQPILGQKFAKHLPHGAGADLITNLMDESKTILEDHEINRVRIDLKENPANMIWPWGQGRKLKTPSFKQRTNLEGAVLSGVDFVKGLAKSLELQIFDNLESAIKEKDFVFVYYAAKNSLELKSKIKRLEDFDALVGKAVQWAKGGENLRIFIGTDCAASIEKKALFHGRVPFLMYGVGGTQDSGAVFSEKFAMQSKFIFDEGHQLMREFLK